MIEVLRQICIINSIYEKDLTYETDNIDKTRQGSPIDNRPSID